VIEPGRASGLAGATGCCERRILAGSFPVWRKRLGGKRRPAFLPGRILVDAHPEPVAATLEIALASSR
jgi:hypothetical protein